MYTKCYHYKVKFGNGSSTKTISTITNIYNLRDSTVITKVMWHMPRLSSAFSLFFFFFLRNTNQNNYRPAYVHFPVSLQKFSPKNPFSLPPPHPRSPSTGTGAVISDQNRWRDLLSPLSLPPKTLSFPPFSSPDPIFSPHRHRASSPLPTVTVDVQI
jgi:hypothetical protein